MTILGVGPRYVLPIFILTALGVYINVTNILFIGTVPALKIPLFIVGILLIVIGIILWINAVFISRISKNIEKGKLVTSGVYAWVRNPIYSAFTLLFTGILCLQNNLILLVLPFVFWLYFSIIVKKEERVLEKVFGKEYLDYKSKVNRCIPWFPF